jgi:hypothetical protein
MREDSPFCQTRAITDIGQILVFNAHDHTDALSPGLSVLRFLRGRPVHFSLPKGDETARAIETDSKVGRQR